MYASKVNPNVSPDDGEDVESPGTESRELSSDQRRLADSLNAKGRKLKLDRRVADSDRRSNEATSYIGPARRKNLDRRERRNSRRNED